MLIYMVGLVELSFFIGATLASVTLCAVKLLKEINHSKCIFISCLGSECIRTVTHEPEEPEEPEEINIPIPRPTLHIPSNSSDSNITNQSGTSSNVSNLRRKYEQK
jgi:hypothetical protein